MSQPLASVRYRKVQDTDLLSLSQALPTLLSGDWSEAALRAMQAANHQLRVLVANAEPVAFAEFQWVADECQLFNIAVLPPWQRQGHGLQLLTALLQESQRQQMQCCVLEVRESNLAARSLYQRAGFTMTGRRLGYYPAMTATGDREAAVLYGCELSGGSVGEGS